MATDLSQKLICYQESEIDWIFVVITVMNTFVKPRRKMLLCVCASAGVTGVTGALNQAKCAAALAAKQGQIAGFVAVLSEA